MEFTKYSSIENSYRTTFLEKCALHVGKRTMVALEKIHGANFSWIVTKDGVRVAKRSGLVDELESFYGHSRFYSRYLPTVKRLFDIVSAEEPNIVQLQLFGEIFGGRYHGLAVNGAKNVQAGMNYHPDTEFAAFDIKLTREDGRAMYMPFVDMEDLILDANALAKEGEEIKITPIIAIGTLEELIKIDPLFHTKVPAVFGIEDDSEKTDSDYGEGFVIRGFHEDFYVGNERVILKQKNSLFKEHDKEVKVKVAADLTEAQKALLEGVCAYINKNRLAAVVSKIGAITQKDFGRVQGELTRDALEDYEKDNGVKAQESEDWGVIAKRVGAHSAGVIREDWLNLLDQ